MYNIIQLNDKDLSELQSIAKELGIKKTDSLKKEDLVYKILDEQAIVIPMVGKCSVCVAVLACRNLRSRIAPKDRWTDALPRLGFAGRHETVFARRACPIRYATEGVYIS